MTSSQHLIMRTCWCLNKIHDLCSLGGVYAKGVDCVYIQEKVKLAQLVCICVCEQSWSTCKTISVLGWCCRSCCKLLFTWPFKTKRFIWLVCVHVCTIILWLTYMVNNFFVWWWGIDGFTSVGNQGDDGGCMTVRQQKEKVCQGIRSKKARTLLTHAL